MTSITELFDLEDDFQFKGPRIVRPAPADEGADHTPGHICWGAVGSLPTAELAPGEGFEVVSCNEQHTEVSRETEDRDIASEDDPDTKIRVKRVKRLFMNKREATTGPNNNAAAAEPEGIGDFAPSPFEHEAFKPLGTESEKKCKYVMTLNTNDDRGI